MQASRLTTTLGWLGMGLVAGAFALNAYEVVSSTNAPYLLMNLAGSIMMGIDMLSRKMLKSGPFGLQIFWGIVSLSALWKLL